MVLRTYNYGLNSDGRVSESASKRLQRHCETIVQSRWLLQRVIKVLVCCTEMYISEVRKRKAECARKG